MNRSWIAGMILAGTMMTTARAGSIPLTVRETGGVDRKGWPITCGVPFPDNEIKAQTIAAGGFRLLDPVGRQVPCQARLAATWGTYPTGSNGYAKWIHLTFLADVAANQTVQYTLQYGGGVSNTLRTDMLAANKPQCVTVTTGKGPGALRVTVSKLKCNVLDEVALDVDGDGFGKDDVIITGRHAPNLRLGYDYTTLAINKTRPEVEIEETGPVMTVLRIKTKLDNRFESIIRIFTYADSPYVKIQETLVHGPTGQNRSAVQTQAVVMKGHVLELPLTTVAGDVVATIGTGEALPEPAAFASTAAPLADNVQVTLEQDLTHEYLPDNLDDTGLNKAFHYNVFANDDKIAAGKRSPGWIDVSDSRWGVTAAMRYFWQSFPKRIVAKADALRLEMWAEGAQLQPLSRNYNWMGMAKTHETMLYFHTGDAAHAKAQDAALAYLNEVFATCQPDYYCRTKAHGRQPLAPALRDDKPLHPDFDDMATAGLNRERTRRAGFYHFQEAEDAYGYFNFGDFLVGPYWGCQEYDPAYCMIQQFYRTGQLKYLEFTAQSARHLYDIDYTHTYTPETSNYPQRSHDKKGSHFNGEDSHGQRDPDTDPGHVFVAGLVNYWYLTGDPRARDVLFWSFPCYLAENWYRITGTGTWRYLGGYVFTIMTYAYELTWDSRYVDLMNWAVREYMVGDHSRHADGIWWNLSDSDDDTTPPRQTAPDGAKLAPPKPAYFCQTWLADSITNGYTQYLEVYPASPYRKAVESAIINLADFLLKWGLTDDFDGVRVGITKPTRDSTGYQPTRGVYAGSMPNMVILTLAKAYHYTGNQHYRQAALKLHAKACEHKDDLYQLKPVTQGTYYPPMALPYLDGTIPPREDDTAPQPIAPLDGWLELTRHLVAANVQPAGTIFVGDDMAMSCAPHDRRGRAWGNAPGWHLTDVLGAIDDVLTRAKPRYVVILVGSSEQSIGHPERSDFEANYARLITKILAAGAIPICTTLPPSSHLERSAWIYNTEIYQSSKMNRVPLIDLHERLADHKPQTPEPDNDENQNIPLAERAKKNTWATGYEQIVRTELDTIIRKIQPTP